MNELTNPSHADVILAAGGIVCRHTPHGDEILIVHRKRYDDWTLPKGKLREGEPFKAAAFREVKEETGCSASVDGYLGAIDYLVEGTPKVVFYWRMSPVQQEQISDHEEVAEVQARLHARFEELDASGQILRSVQLTEYAYETFPVTKIHPVGTFSRVGL